MNPYDILGLVPDCSAADIKQAYKLAAQKYHPDRENGNRLMFDEAKEAYDILNDNMRRSRYDMFGDTTSRREHDVDALVAGIFASVIDLGNYQGDIIDRCQHVVTSQSAENNKTVLNLKAKQQSMKGQLGQVSKKSGQSMFDKILSQKIQQIMSTIDQLEHKQDELRILNDGLSDYRDGKSQPVAATGTATTGTTYR